MNFDSVQMKSHTLNDKERIINTKRSLKTALKLKYVDLCRKGTTQK